MPKRKPKARQNVAAEGHPQPRGDSDGEGREGDALEEKAPPHSRGQRKRQAKRDGFVRRFELVNSLRQEHKEGTDGAFSNLAHLAEAADTALEEGKALPPKVLGKVNRPISRKAQALAGEREMNQYQQVIKLDAFQKDPLGALEQHIKNSIKKQKQDEEKHFAKLKQQGIKQKQGKRPTLQSGKPINGPKRVINSKLKKKNGTKRRGKVAPMEE
mmetsp:Transcript_57885/g.134858  ORF Transcript_57885/g.134858 Transcript_57885/m.134858 type:complete len:214 (+) Transcript_57885:74-715(+)